MECKLNYDKMCEKGKRCVGLMMNRGESRSKALRECWKKVGVILDNEADSRMAA